MAAMFSIKRRIVVAVVTTELLLVICLVFLAAFIVRRSSIRSFDTSLRGRAMMLTALVRYSEGAHPELYFDQALLPPQLSESAPDLFRIETGHGRMLASSNSGFSFPEDRQQISWGFSFQGTPYRALRLRNVPVLDTEDSVGPNKETLDVIYASPTKEMSQAMFRAFTSIFAAGVLLLAISVYASVRAIEKGLRPVSELASSASAISASNWNLKVTDSAVNVVEIAPLTHAMSQMVATLHAAFQQQRDFTSNAAHELKTPVAVLKSTLQSLLQEPRSAETYRAGILDALSDLERLETLLHAMLRLSRAEQRAGTGGSRENSDVDVVATCEAAIARLTSIAQSREAVISLAVPDDPLMVQAEPEDLEIVWSNLIENAVRYGPQKSEVRVVAARSNGSVWVTVEDSGPGMAASEIPKVFERFHRGEPSRARETGGYGLGLAIAKAFVECYGGSISAGPNEPRGTRIRVELPSSRG